MTSTDERLEAVRARLTPTLRETIEKAAAGGMLPHGLQEALTPSARRFFGIGQIEPGVLASQTASPGLESSAGQSIAGIEAIVQRTGRPPLLVRRDGVDIENLSEFPIGTDILIRGLERRMPSVGRIEFLNYSMSWGGTGWVVADSADRRLVITNRHVAGLVAKRKANGRAIFIRGPQGQRYGAAINFLAEAGGGTDRSRTVALTSVEYLADDAAADVALLEIGTAGFDLPDPIDLDDDVRREGELVAVIGYPAHDSRNDLTDQARYFRDLYEVKRLSPGFITQAPESGGYFTHDCTTLGGNSGSPLILLTSGKAVGLHFSGVYGKNNWAVTAATITALLRGERPVAARLAAAPQERPDGHHPPEHFVGRAGFKTDFLEGGHPTPWPGLPDALVEQLASPIDEPSEPNELRYTHFGVKYSTELKIPLITAVNIDGANAVRIKRGDDRWFSDGRIPSEVQLGGMNFADALIDRGHMVRREDPNWGKPAEAQNANSDTFHYVNATAQHSSLNQGKMLWQGLENYILDSVRTRGFKACVFTGPVLRSADEEDETIIDGAIVALEFWKVVVTLDAADSGIHATAYLLSQGELIRTLMDSRSRSESLEGFTLGAYRTFQVSISDLAAATGYDFSAYVGADPLTKSAAGAEAAQTGEPLFLPLETLDDIRL